MERLIQADSKKYLMNHALRVAINSAIIAMIEVTLE